MDDGTRTHDNRDHNPGLYQLSYAHHLLVPTMRLACPAGLEPATLGLEGRCSIHLSYAPVRFLLYLLQLRPQIDAAKLEIG